MRYTMIFLLTVLAISCQKEGIAPTSMVDAHMGQILDESHESSAERLPCVESWRNAQTIPDSISFDGGYVLGHRVKNGPNAGYWHSPKEVGLFAYNSHAYFDGRWTRINYSADDRFSSITDISYKERGTTYWRPAKVIEWPDGSRRVERFLNRMRHDNQGPAVVNIDAQGDTTYRACYNCDILVPCP